MVKYHPDTRFLTDYAAGSLPESQALCVAAHLHYCTGCRNKVGDLASLGGELLLDQQPATVSDGCFDRVMARLDASDADNQAATATLATSDEDPLPRAIRKLTRGNLENLNWRRIGKSFRFFTLSLGDKRRETSLLHIAAGGNLPKHHHGGDEITVVLQGSFSDQEGHYHVGDYIVRTRGETHTPVASQDEDCLCLATLDAPIVMNNWLLRLLMPFFNRPTPT